MRWQNASQANPSVDKGNFFYLLLTLITIETLFLWHFSSGGIIQSTNYMHQQAFDEFVFHFFISKILHYPKIFMFSFTTPFKMLKPILNETRQFLETREGMHNIRNWLHSVRER